ncbi:SPL family radical SAM protein [Clostridium sp. JS66]|uniref:SPL family radical SAM protein n=1 Tax=Clostridium sp. JS66 TaxID=3064705 RepID=UPI00298DD1B1|nr:radical SAM protein [Clostridium sp. JS66]WPC39626.1 radical SAM protein [Clostridium sp. JS66]
MVREINAKSILVTSKNPSSWFGVKYTMNIYRGCQHGCIYCDSRSECYQIQNFDDIDVKINAVELLKKELVRKRIKGTIGTGAMSDPYIPIEKKYRLTQKSLQVIADNHYPVHITTKSNIILRDIDILQQINNIYAQVAITITTYDDSLSQKIEPRAPVSSDRFKALGILSSLGIHAGITLMPILPFIEDNEENIIKIIEMSKDYGVKFIYPAFGMTLRDRQKEYYYSKLDELFPNLKSKYEKRFKNYYSCSINNYTKLKNVFFENCDKYGISTKMPSYESKLSSIQLSFLNKKL